MQKKLNHVVLISSSFPTTGEGAAAAGSFVNDFAIELSKLTKVTVLTPGLAKSEEQVGKIKVVRFKVPQLPLSLLRLHLPKHWLHVIRTLQSGSFELNYLIDRDEVDHIFALWTLPCGFWAYRANQKHAITYSCWALGSDIWAFQKNAIGRYFLNTVLSNAQNLFADGYALARDVKYICKKDCKFLPSTRILPKLPDKNKTHTGTRFAFLGRWHLNKGIDLFLDALLSLEEQEWNDIDEIIIAGGGPLEQIVSKKYNDLITNRHPIKLLGYLNKDEAANLIHWTDYLVIPSRIESIPVIFSDALQMNTPIVATPTGDIPKLFDNYNLGILCDSISAESIALSIKLACNRKPSTFNNEIKRANVVFDIKSTAKMFYDSI